MVDPNTSFLVGPTNPGYEWCLVSITLTLKKGGVPNSDGFVTWVDVVNAPISALTATEILFNTVSYNPVYIGEYAVSLEYAYSTATIVVRTFTYTVVDPCILGVVPPASIPSYT